MQRPREGSAVPLSLVAIALVLCLTTFATGSPDTAVKDIDTDDAHRNPAHALLASWGKDADHAAETPLPPLKKAAVGVAAHSREASSIGGSEDEADGSSSSEESSSSSSSSSSGDSQSARGIPSLLFTQVLAAFVFACALAAAVAGLCCARRGRGDSRLSASEFPPTDLAPGDQVTVVAVDNGDPSGDVTSDTAGDQDDPEEGEEGTALLSASRRSHPARRSPSDCQSPSQLQQQGGAGSAEAAGRWPSISRRWKQLLFGHREPLEDSQEDSQEEDANHGSDSGGGRDQRSPPGWVFSRSSEDPTGASHCFGSEGGDAAHPIGAMDSGATPLSSSRHYQGRGTDDDGDEPTLALAKDASPEARRVPPVDEPAPQWEGAPPDALSYDKDGSRGDCEGQRFSRSKRASAPGPHRAPKYYEPCQPVRTTAVTSPLSSSSSSSPPSPRQCEMAEEEEEPITREREQGATRQADAERVSAGDGPDPCALPRALSFECRSTGGGESGSSGSNGGLDRPGVPARDGGGSAEETGDGATTAAASGGTAEVGVEVVGWAQPLQSCTPTGERREAVTAQLPLFPKVPARTSLAAMDAVCHESDALVDDLAFYAIDDYPAATGASAPEDQKGSITPVVVFTGASSVSSYVTTATAETPPLFVSTRGGTPLTVTPPNLMLCTSDSGGSNNTVRDEHTKEGDTVAAMAANADAAAQRGESGVDGSAPSPSVRLHEQPPQEGLPGAVEHEEEGAEEVHRSSPQPVKLYYYEQQVVLPPMAYTYTSGGLRGPRSPSFSQPQHRASHNDNDNDNGEHGGAGRGKTLSLPATTSTLDGEEVAASADGGNGGGLVSSKSFTSLSGQEREVLLKNRKWLFPLIEGADEL